MSGAIVIEATLSFLGAGIRPPQPSWGNMIAEGQAYLGTANQIIFVPAVFLCVTALSLNLLGDAIRVRTQ
jgi:peptide/nickel transport system permease protein